MSHFRLLLSIVLLCGLSTFAAQSTENILAAQPVSIEGEWILVRSDIRVSWNEIRNFFPSGSWIKSFGPLEKFALIKSKTQWRGPLPRGLGSIQPNFLYRALDAKENNHFLVQHGKSKSATRVSDRDTKDPDFAKSWGLENIGQEIPVLGLGIRGMDISVRGAWSISDGSEAVSIAVLDSGIDLSHEDLQSNLWKNKGEIASNGRDDDGNGYIDDINGWNFVDDNNKVMDDNNHGSFVSGIIAADKNNGKGTRGILGKTKLLTVKMLDNNGLSTTERAILAIQYAVNNGAKIINASWGGPVYDQALYDTVKWTGERGVLFVAAAGNEPKDNDVDEKPNYPSSFRLPNILSVAAIDNQGKLANFSSFGKETVHLGAPGVGVYSSIIGGYKFSEGTSFAAPHVSAVAGLLISQFPELSYSEIKKRIIESTTPLHYYLKEKLSSGGMLNAENAMKNIRPPRPQPPTQWKVVSKSTGTAHPYANDSKQIFEFYSPGAKNLRVHFKGFSLERSYDVVKIRDKNAIEAIQYTGKLGDFWSADVLGDTLRVEFQSDFSNTDYGFDIDAYGYNDVTAVSVKP